MAAEQMAAAIRKGAETAQRRVSRVPAAAAMDDETFFKHYNARHLEDVGMVAHIHHHDTVSAGMVATFRAYHDRVHATTDVTGHTHKEDGE